MDAPFNPWKWLTLFGGGFFLLTWLCPLYLALFALQVALRLLGFRGGGGFFKHMMLHRLFESLFRAPEKVPVYHHMVHTGTALGSVRQEGDFTDGRIGAGHDVALRGYYRGSTFVITGGQNTTLRCQLTCPSNKWKSLFAVLLIFWAGVAAMIFMAAPT